ncbi:MAG: molybdopterin-dependent oxidoreductase [bacterium]|nr:molybdopterin-dependent oxidoreductase [bacterium]
MTMREPPRSETRDALSFCRQCMGMCGTVVTLDANDRVVSVRGDHDDPSTLGYACFKGLNASEGHNSPDRFLQPMKRKPGGRLEPVELETALDEIAEKIAALLESDGPESIAGYRGGGAFFSSSSVMMLPALLRAIGTPKAYSSITIDQSAKEVTAGRLGVWPPGRTPFSRSDVYLLVGSNPLVSVSANGFDTRNPTKRLRAARERGMKFIVVDPRCSETAQQADIHLQPLPGEDCTLLAGLLHIILAEGWQDQEFCARYADDVEAFERAVAPFTPEAVARRADVPVETLREAARLFAQECSTGPAAGATGPDMSPGGNLAEHLIECLNVICGRYLREGDEIEHPGAIHARQLIKAEVIPAARWWEHGFKSRIGGFGQFSEEFPTGTLPDEILEPGPGRVRCLFSHGGNPASAIPEIEKVERAFEALDLLVAIEPFPSMTTAMADYVLPSTLQYERADLPMWLWESLISAEPYTRYTPALARPPEGSCVRDDHYYFWAIAKRLGLTLQLFGEPLDIETAPTTDEILARTAKNAPIPFEQIQSAERGILFDHEKQFVEPGDPDSPHRFSLLPEDVASELREFEAVLAMPALGGDGFDYRLAVRRIREANNSAGLGLPSIKRRIPFNPAFMNPEDMKAEGVAEGDAIEIASRHGAIRALATADPTLRRGVVSIVHGFGGLPRDKADYSDVGVSTNWLTSLDTSARETINAMPWMGGFPVSVRRVDNT